MAREGVRLHITVLPVLELFACHRIISYSYGFASMHGVDHGNADILRSCIACSLAVGHVLMLLPQGVVWSYGSYWGYEYAPPRMCVRIERLCVTSFVSGCIVCASSRNPK